MEMESETTATTEEKRSEVDPGEDFKYRNQARIVGFIYVILAVINTILFIFFFMKLWQPEQSVLVGVFVVFSVGACVLEIFGGIRLIQAAGRNAHPLTALKQARFWRSVCVFFLVVLCVSYMITLAVFNLIITIVIRGVFLHYVERFITELEIAVKAFDSESVGGDDCFMQCMASCI